MLPAEVLVVLAAAATVLLRPQSLPVTMAFVLIWVTAPLVAYWVSRRTVPPLRIMTGEDLRFARLLARRTWRFFETFVGAEDNWLPPDNFQEDPKPMVAHRTSPTNIGMLLLSTLSAHDFGYIGTYEFVERTELDIYYSRQTQPTARPFPKLVRHQDSSAASPAIHLDGGQRQSCRSSHRTQAGLH